MKRYFVFGVIVLGILGFSLLPAKAIDTSGNATYASGKWRYEYQITAAGTKSETRLGKLTYDGKQVETLTKAQFYDRIQTPWGRMQYCGARGYSSGWLTKLTYDKPLKLNAGRLLSVPGDSTPIAIESNIEALVAGNTAFALDLYAKLKDEPDTLKPDGNLFFSPYSISAALAMTYAGARGETEKQMAQVLHFTLPQQSLHPAFAASGKKIKVTADELQIASALWGQKDYKFLQSFLDINRKYYSAGLKEVDFVMEPEKARKVINAWVEKQTQDKIKELIQKGVVDNATLVLTNAIYFKGDWASKFKEENTHDAGFDLGGPKTMIQIIQVPMMQQKGKFKYAERDKLQILELPYKGKELSMIILLPKKGPYLALDALKELEKSLTLKNLEKWLAELREQEVMVYLPRFKMTWGVFELKDILKAMGMTAAFSGADFSGMTGRRDLFISNVLHKAFVEVNEEGTEAAAATAVVMRKAAVAIPVFRADHPFVFMIKDNRSGSILFMGRVMNPAKQS